MRRAKRRVELTANPSLSPPSQIQEAGGKTLAEFLEGMKGRADIAALRGDVQAFAKKFPMPGFDVASMEIKD